MKNKQINLFIFILCIIVLCFCLRMTSVIEPSNVYEPNIEDNLKEIEVERVNPDITNTKTKVIKKNKNKKTKTTSKSTTQIYEDGTTVIFEDITAKDKKTNEAVVSIEQDEIPVNKPAKNVGYDWSTYDPTTDDTWDIHDIKLPDDLTDEIDNQI